MARGNSNNSAKPAETPVTDAANTASQTAATNPVETAAVPGSTTAVGGAPEAPQQLSDTAATTTASADTPSGAASVTLDSQPSADDEAQAEVDTDDKGEITIYPLRSYLDGKDVRRAGGKGYKSPKHDAVSLIAAGLATDKKPKA